MPSNRQKYLEWDGERFRKWAALIGTNTVKTVDAILTSKPEEQSITEVAAMSNESTINKLVEMHMTPMANAFQVQLSDPNIGRLSFEERFTLMVDTEYNSRKTSCLKRLIHNAGFDQLEVYIGDINYTSGRMLDRNQIGRLAGYGYIADKRNIFITGATG